MKKITWFNIVGFLLKRLQTYVSEMLHEATLFSKTVYMRIINAGGYIIGFYVLLNRTLDILLSFTPEQRITFVFKAQLDSGIIKTKQYYWLDW